MIISDPNQLFIILNYFTEESLKKIFEMAKLKFRLQAMCVVFWEPTTNAPFVANYIKQTSSWNSCERKWNVFDFAKNNFSSNVFEVISLIYFVNAIVVQSGIWSS